MRYRIALSRVAFLLLLARDFFLVIDASPLIAFPVFTSCVLPRVFSETLQACNVSENTRGSTQEVNTGKAINGDASITKKKSRASNNKKATRDNAIRYRIYRRDRLLTG